MVIDSPSRGFLTRIRSKTSSLSLPGLRSPRRRVLTDFHIQLDDPHRVYSPTDVVHGRVCIKVERPLNITHLVVNLVGRVDLQPSLSFGKEIPAKSKEWDDDYDDGLSGAITLCRDRMVLCGEGRLEPGVYQFGFQLDFVPVGKLASGLPSSLDFEKGSILYAVSSTITRPTTISPTTTCTTKLSLMETIDIAHLPLPKPRTISLEPLLSKRSSRSKSRPRTPSPIAGDYSTMSSPSSSSGNLQPSEIASSLPTPPLIKRKTIRASIELMKAGALRGDNIPLKISIHHTKPIKSLNGIILTLHRQTRFDPPSRYHPPLKKALTSAAGGGNGGGTFRKDLSQTVLPLIIDPTSLTTVVKANLRVPEDVFPTISNVPGDGVSFRYYVEVVVDLGGKLNSRGVDIFDSGSSIPGLPRPSSREEKDSSSGNTGAAIEGGVMVETEKIRREKSIVFCRFEVIIGSVDSVGGTGRRGAIPTKTVTLSPAVEEAGGVDVAPPSRQPPPVLPDSASGQAGDRVPEYVRHENQEQSLPQLAQEEVQPQGDMDEKTQMIRAEESLLPSAPPGMGDFLEPGPSAPLLDQSASEYYPHQPPVPPGEEQDSDKMERERQRLLAAASAPGEGNQPESSGSAATAPSAPVLAEGFDGGPPRYFR